MKLFKKFLIFFISLFLLIELILFFTYFFSRNTIFENRFETENRATIERGILKNNILEDSYKIAVFGGSSAAGWGATINFAQILNNFSILSNQKIYVDNHASPGTPFYSHQAEKIKKVINEYDLFIIYAGHNEYINYEHSKAFFPNGVRSWGAYSKQKNLQKKINKEIKNTMRKSRYFSTNSKLFNDFTDKIRILNFSYRVVIYLKEPVLRFYYKYFVHKKIGKEEYKIKYYYDEIFYDKINGKKKWEKNFRQSIDEIHEMLPRGKRLIIITALPNYIIPPVADFASDTSSSREIDVSNLYKKIRLNKRLNKDEILKLPRGAHRAYILGQYCLENSIDKNECVDHFVKAKNLDQFTTTILKPIQEFIKYEIPKNYKKFEVVDLTDFNKKIFLETEVYKNFFLDLMHPSKYGHAFIANKIASKIFDFPVKANLVYNPDTPRCPGVEYYVKNKLKKTYTTPKMACDTFLLRNKRWHEKFSHILPKDIKFINDFYINQANQF